MLKIYSKDQTSKLNREIVKVPWDNYFMNYEVTNFLDETDQKIVESVEKTSIVDNNTITGKFSDMKISIGLLSEGCKTLLCINHAIKTKAIDELLFDVTSCGPNAISYLAKDMAKDVDIYAYCRHPYFGSAECEISINDEIFNNSWDASMYYSECLEEL